MSKYKYNPRLFVVRVDGFEIKILTIDGCEPDDTIYYYEKEAHYSEFTRIGVVIKIRHGQWIERLFDDISHYDVDTFGFEQIWDLYADVIEGYKKAVSNL